jgi:hypothetical protein
VKMTTATTTISSSAATTSSLDADSRVPWLCDVLIASQQGWVYRESHGVCVGDSVNGNCMNQRSATHAEASKFCSSVGARLCTADELQSADLAVTTRCNIDNHYVWSSSSCGAGHHHISFGSSAHPVARSCQPDAQATFSAR